MKPAELMKMEGVEGKSVRDAMETVARLRLKNAIDDGAPLKDPAIYATKKSIPVWTPDGMVTETPRTENGKGKEEEVAVNPRTTRASTGRNGGDVSAWRVSGGVPTGVHVPPPGSDLDGAAVAAMEENISLTHTVRDMKRRLQVQEEQLAATTLAAKRREREDGTERERLEAKVVRLQGMLAERQRDRDKEALKKSLPPHVTREELGGPKPLAEAELSHLTRTLQGMEELRLELVSNREMMEEERREANELRYELERGRKEWEAQDEAYQELVRATAIQMAAKEEEVKSLRAELHLEQAGRRRREEEAEARREVLERELRESEGKLSRIDDALARKDEEHQTTTEAVLAELNTLRAQVSSLTEQLHAANAEASEREMEGVAAQERLRKANRDEARMLREEMQSVEAERDLAREEREAAVKEARDREKALEEALAERSRELTAAQRQAEQHKQLYRQMEEEAEERSRFLAKEGGSRAKEHQLELERQLGNHERERLQMEERIRELMTAVEEGDRREASLRKEVDELREGIKAVTEERKMVERELKERLQRESDAHESERGRLETVIREREGALVGLRREKDAAAEHCGVLHAENEALKIRAQAAEQHLAEQRARDKFEGVEASRIQRTLKEAARAAEEAERVARMRMEEVSEEHGARIREVESALKREQQKSDELTQQLQHKEVLLRTAKEEAARRERGSEEQLSLAVKAEQEKERALTDSDARLKLEQHRAAADRAEFDQKEARYHDTLKQLKEERGQLRAMLDQKEQELTASQEKDADRLGNAERGRRAALEELRRVEEEMREKEELRGKEAEKQALLVAALKEDLAKRDAEVGRLMEKEASARQELREAEEAARSSARAAANALSKCEEGSIKAREEARAGERRAGLEASEMRRQREEALASAEQMRLELEHVHSLLHGHAQSVREQQQQINDLERKLEDATARAGTMEAQLESAQRAVEELGGERERREEAEAEVVAARDKQTKDSTEVLTLRQQLQDATQAHAKALVQVKALQDKLSSSSAAPSSTADSTAAPATKEAGRTRELVQETWKLVEQELDAHAVQFFLRIFEIAPPALQLFSFKDETPLAESPGLKKHATGVLNTVGTAVAGLSDVEKLVPVLEALGGRHATYGVQREHFAIVGQALLWTLEQGLGDRWTAEVEAAWAQTYATVQSIMEPALVHAQQKQ